MTELELPTPENPLRDVNYIAEAVGFTPATIREYLRDGKIKGRKDADSGEWKVLDSDYRVWVQKKWGAS